jgi:elongation factor P
MINVNDLKVGMTIMYENNIYSVMDTQHVKPGKGAAFVQAKLKNLRSGAIIENRFNSSDKVEPARIEKKPMQFLYQMNDVYYFMDMNTYEQVEINKSQIGDDAELLKENLTVDIMFFEGEMLGMNLPDKIELKVTHTEPAVKGNTTSSAMKDATLETGKVIKVPLFIEQDEVILVSSKDGKYVSRA